MKHHRKDKEVGQDCKHHICAQTKGNSQWQWQCKLCGENFKQKYALKSHIYLKHNQNLKVVVKKLIRNDDEYPTFSNLLCPHGTLRPFEDSTEFSKHLMLHANEPMNQCPMRDTNLNNHKEMTYGECQLSTEDTNSVIYSKRLKSSRCVSAITTTDMFSQTTSNSKRKNVKKANNFWCIQCNKQFTTNGGRKRKIHMKGQHSGGRKDYKCSTCGKAFAYGTNLHIHMKIHSREKKYVCESCSYKTTNSSDLKKHVKVHSKEKPFKCKFCESAFARKHCLHVHTRTRTKEKPYACSLCPYSCTTQGSLRDHLTIYSDERPFSCPSCPWTFSLKRSLKNHISTVHLKIKNHSCTICNKAFASPVTLANHIRGIHTKDRPFKCAHCGKGFTQRSHQIGHERRIHLQIKSFVCVVCGKSFVDKQELIYHMTVHTGEEPYKCEIKGCDKTFRSNTTRRMHMRATHSDSKIIKWLCTETECERSFSTKTFRNRHVRKIHLNEKNIKCSVCGKLFFEISECNIHLRTHAGETPYKCRHCPRAFIQSKTRNLHEKNTHSLTMHKQLNSKKSLKNLSEQYLPRYKHCHKAFISFSLRYKHEITIHCLKHTT